MAKLSFSAVVEQVRGKVGTVVFSEARNGASLRIKSSVKNPKTNAQRAVRKYLSRSAKTFEGLSLAQAALWNAYGETQQRTDPVTGKTYTLSGINAFVELAIKFLQVQPNGTIPLGPPNTEFSGDTVTVTATAGVGQVLFSGSGPNALGVTTEFLVQRLPARNRKPDPNGYVSAGFKALGTGNLDFVATVTPGVYAVAYRFVRVATGQASEIEPLPLQTVTFSVEEGGSVPASKKRAA